MRASTAEALGKMGPPAEAVPRLIQALGDEDLLVRTSAAEALGPLGPAAAEVFMSTALLRESLIPVLALTDVTEPAHGSLLQLRFLNEQATCKSAFQSVKFHCS